MARLRLRRRKPFRPEDENPTRAESRPRWQIAAKWLNFRRSGISFDAKVFQPMDDEKPLRMDESPRRGTQMKKFGFAGIIAGGLVAAVVGLAAPAQADLSHDQWANSQNQQSASVPHVDTSVHQSP
jgi:hypothetical protein